MKKVLLLASLFFFAMAVQAQKKNKSKNVPSDYQVSDTAAPSQIPASKKGKGKKEPAVTNYQVSDTAAASQLPSSKKGKGKSKVPAAMDYSLPDPVADTNTRFTGVIKYLITTDDAADRDSMMIVFGENQIRVTMYIPGYMAKDIFENTTIANFKDTVLYVLDNRTKTYKEENLAARNAGTEFSLSDHKKSTLVLKVPCGEYSGQMTMKDGEAFEVACLMSKQHSYLPAQDYYFLNIQPVVIGYKIVLGYRTKTSNNENTYIMAYSIQPGNTDSYFDLSQYKKK